MIKRNLSDEKPYSLDMGVAMSSDIFLCFECGSRNRVSVSTDRDRNKAKCGKCGAMLFPSKEDDSTRSASPQPKNTLDDTKGSSKKSTLILLTTLGVIVAGFFIMILDSSPDNSRSSNYNEVKPSQPTTTSQVEPSQTKPVVQVEPLPPAVNQKVGIMWNKTGRQPEAPLAIKTNSGKNFFVKLVNSATGRDMVGIYVVGGQPFETLVPLGSYKIKYAYGDTWRGEQHLFGPNEHTGFSETTWVFNFKISDGYVEGYEIELILQIDGNLPVREINKSQF